MGESILCKYPTGKSDGDIIVLPTHHSILVKVIGPNNYGLAVNFPISCKDGSAYYNYTTNEKGQCLFMVNSGTANIFACNIVNGTRYIDISNSWTNIDAPVGSKTILNIVLANGPTSITTTTEYNFTTAVTRNVNIALVGGGGGGGSGVEYSRYEVIYYGGCGGAGYLNWYNNYTIEGGNKYRFIPGSGGSGSRSIQSNGSSGGSSYIYNTNMSAAGGSGGGNSFGNKSTSWIGAGGIGGLGNGANGGSKPSSGSESASSGSGGGPGGDSSVSFAGGGGGTNGQSGGSPYGGTASANPSTISGNARGMGGGGAGSPYWDFSTEGYGSGDFYNAGSGYNGGMVINIKY